MVECAATMVRILQPSAFSGFVFGFLSFFPPLQAGVVRQEGKKLKKKQLDGKQQSRNDRTKRRAALTARRPSSRTRSVPW